ncbi:MAG: hypothetical protein WAL63_04340 [Solirubrobacteraceae bacterium]
MRRWTHLIALLSAAATLAVVVGGAAPALAAGGNPVINNCESQGRLTTTYSLAQLQHALAIMPASVKQYTNCYDVIQSAIQAAKQHKTGTVTDSSSSGGSFLPTPVIVILVILILAAITFGAIAIRRHRAGAGPAGPGDDAPPPAGSP